MYRTICLFMFVILIKSTAVACDQCQAQQPRILRAISHGIGPETKWDLWIVSLVAAFVVFTLFYSVKWLIVPGEKSKDHIKNLVITNA